MRGKNRGEPPITIADERRVLALYEAAPLAANGLQKRSGTLKHISRRTNFPLNVVWRVIYEGGFAVNREAEEVKSLLESMP